jgi:hypothetical protein
MEIGFVILKIGRVSNGSAFFIVLPEENPALVGSYPIPIFLS